MIGYTTREVAEILGISTAQVRSFARSGLLSPEQGTGTGLRFTFQDIVILRAAQGLKKESLSPQRIRRALQRLRDQLPEGRPLSAVTIVAAGDHVEVRDKGTAWDPETEQVTFDFSVRELATRVEPFAGAMAREHAESEELDADDWYDLGWDLEAVSVPEAKEAYRRALRIRADHIEARVNLGRLLHEDGELAAAEAEYRQALDHSPPSPLAAFNLGVALEDQGREDSAAMAYELAVELDPSAPEPHFNLARLRERAGDASGALRHLAEYRRLTGGGGLRG
jgi:tetratricopeptide (TPR) repeat protein